MDHHCLTQQELANVKGDKQKMKEMLARANSCVLCMRTWMKFWASQSQLSK